MESIGKKQLKKLACPKCGKPKLRLAHSADGLEPDGGNGVEKKLRFDACKNDFLEGNESLQAQWRSLLQSTTPPPVAGHRR
jgi:hypothetical protein